MITLKIFKFVDIYGKWHKYAGYIVNGEATQETVKAINFIRHYGCTQEQFEQEAFNV